MDRTPKRQKLEPGSNDDESQIKLIQLVEIRRMYDLLELKLGGSDDCTCLLNRMEFEYAYTIVKGKSTKRLKPLTDGTPEVDPHQ